MSLTLMPTSSTPWGVNISKLGKADSSTSISTLRWSSAPARSLARNFSRVCASSSSGSSSPASGRTL